jgi:hypothetical protein
MSRGSAYYSAFLVADGGLGIVAHSTARLFKDIPVLVHVRATFTPRWGWSVRPGPLALSGTVELPGLSAEFLFREHPETELPPGATNRATATIVKPGHAIPIPAQRLSMAPRDESELWVRFSDPTQRPLWTEHRVGRCTSRPLAFDCHLTAQGSLHAFVTPDESADGHGTKVEITGQLRFEHGLNMRLMLRDVGYTPSAAAEYEACEATLLPRGTIVQLAKQGAWASAGPRPWISLRVLEAGGRVVGDEHRLGRSVRMR